MLTIGQVSECIATTCVAKLGGHDSPLLCVSAYRCVGLGFRNALEVLLVRDSSSRLFPCGQSESVVHKVPHTPAYCEDLP